MNNYGVWKDEFRELGLESTLDVSWDDAMCYFGENKEVRVGRGYGRWECFDVKESHAHLSEHPLMILHLGSSRGTLSIPIL